MPVLTTARCEGLEVVQAEVYVKLTTGNSIVTIFITVLYFAIVTVIDESQLCQDPNGIRDIDLRSCESGNIEADASSPLKSLHIQIIVQKVDA